MMLKHVSERWSQGTGHSIIPFVLAGCKYPKHMALTNKSHKNTGPSVPTNPYIGLSN